MYDLRQKLDCKRQARAEQVLKKGTETRELSETIAHNRTLVAIPKTYLLRGNRVAEEECPADSPSQNPGGISGKATLHA